MIEKRMKRLIYRGIYFTLLFCFCAVFIFSATMLTLHYGQMAREDREYKRLAALVADDSPLQRPSGGHTLEPVGTTPIPTQSPQEPVMLEQYRNLYEQNTDMIGWIRIDDTKIDYPVMYTADDFYLSHGFDKKGSKSGVPFIDERCTVAPFGMNTIIYGHHMRNGTMFADLLKYVDSEYYMEHPIIQFDTLYEKQIFEIIAVFRSQIYLESDRVFKHYDFLGTDDATVFDKYIANIKAISLYDTGVIASFGDELLTLITCAYHTENGQFVVVANKHHIEQTE